MKYLLIPFLLIFLSCSDSKEEVEPKEEPENLAILNWGYYEWTSPDGVLYDVFKINIINREDKNAQVKIVFKDPYGGSEDFESHEFVCFADDFTLYQYEFIRPDGKTFYLSEEDIEIIFVKYVTVG